MHRLLALLWTIAVVMANTTATTTPAPTPESTDSSSPVSDGTIVVLAIVIPLAVAKVVGWL